MKRILSLILTLSLLLGCMSGLARAGENTGKYVQDVFIAYGKTEDEARAWLTANGWEPVNGDFCAGKNSTWDDPIAAVMGIRRTDDATDAVTDMAVMNMSGGYSFPAYESLVEKKQAEIDEFIGAFLPVLQEYRANYKGQGSAAGKARAELACLTLNKFFDGGESERYRKNDTGRKLGELFLDPIRQEGSTNGADLQQIILESSGAAMYAVEISLAIASDTAEDTWLQRLSGLTGSDLIKNLPKYVPEAAGQNLAASAAKQFLQLHFKDGAAILAEQWDDVNESMLWYEEYNNENDLWPEDGESDNDYVARVEQHFRDLEKTQSKETVEALEKQYDQNSTLYNGLYEMSYKGEWGDTLGDFFNPYDQSMYKKTADDFLTFAAAMSPGQRASLEFMPLSTLLLIGMQTKEGVEQLMPDLSEMLGDKLDISVYSGINRGIFRGGVALTNRADMERSSERDPFDFFSFSGMYNILAYSCAIAGVPFLVTGVSLWIAGRAPAETVSRVKELNTMIQTSEKSIENANFVLKNGVNLDTDILNAQILGDQASITQYRQELSELQSSLKPSARMSTAGKILTCVGAVLLLVAAGVKFYQLYEYYQHTFTPIPLMIVDEADIVTYTTDAEGNSVENIDFDQYVYYQAVKCNRQEVGKLSDWQDGVAQYKENGCGDIADLNGDFGQEWLALYTVKSPKKGDPILADTLTVQYGSSTEPKNYAGKLHKFTYTNAMDLGDTAYSYNNDKNGVYFFWDSDPKAYDTPKTASAFTGGQLAMSGAAGLALGLLGATAILRPRKKKEQEA